MICIEQFNRSVSCVDVNELRGIANKTLNPAVDPSREAGSSSTEHTTTAGLFTLMPFGSNEQRSAGLTTRITCRDAGAVDRIGGCLFRGKAGCATYQEPRSETGQAVKRLGARLPALRGDTSPDGTGSVVQAPLCRDDNPNQNS